MDIILSAFSEGGVFVYLVLLSTLAGMAASLVQLIAGRKATLGPVIAAGVAGTVLLGLLGSFAGAVRTFDAVEAAVSGESIALLARGASLSFKVAFWAMLAAGVQLMAGALACTLRSNKA